MRPFLAVCLFALFVACSHAPAPQRAAVNPAGFPFYPESTVLATRTWHHALSPAERRTLGIVGAGRGAYAGHEVVTATQAQFADLVAWLHGLDANPPKEYRIGVWGNGVEDAREQARDAGLDFGIFDSDVPGRTHVVAVVVVDPSLLQRKAGLMLSALRRFQYLPGFLRAPLDAQARAQTGFSVSEALDPTTPIGAAVDALALLDDAHARGVIFVDASPAR